MYSRGGPEMSRSAWLAGLMNKWFDFMNTRLQYGYNRDLEPYRSKEDPRLEWLSTTFVQELEQWRDSIEGNSRESEKKFLSKQTFTGLVMSSKGMVELIRFLLSVSPSGSYVLSSRVNQDPLEAFFGLMRKTGGRNTAPSVNLYGYYQNIISCQ